MDRGIDHIVSPTCTGRQGGCRSSAAVRGIHTEMSVPGFVLLWRPATRGRASCPPPVLLQGGGHGVHPLDPQCWRTFRSNRHEDRPLNLPRRLGRFWTSGLTPSKLTKKPDPFPGPTPSAPTQAMNVSRLRRYLTSSWVMVVSPFAVLATTDCLTNPTSRTYQLSTVSFAGWPASSPLPAP